MKLSIMQPYFLPYIGYFQLIAKSDLFVIYDDVNYIKNGWINRNTYMDNKGDIHYFTLPISGGSSNNLIKEVLLRPTYRKIEKTLKQNYSKYLFLNNTAPLLESIFDYQTDNLSQFVSNSIIKTVDFLDINTPIITSSSLKFDKTKKGQERVIAICKAVGATHYINNISGKHLYDQNTFNESNLELSFHSPDLTGLEEPTRFLSILHQLMHLDKTQLRL